MRFRDNQRVSIKAADDLVPSENTQRHRYCKREATWLVCLLFVNREKLQEAQEAIAQLL